MSTTSSPAVAGIAGIVGVALVAGCLAAVPALLTADGCLQLAALLRGAWDPTWNDGDLGIAAGGFAVLLIVLAGAVGGGVLLAGPARLRRTHGALIAGAAAALVGALGAGLCWAVISS